MNFRYDIQALRGFAVLRIRLMGKKAIIISPPPSNGYDTSSCQERRETHKLSFGRNAQCKISLSKAREQTADVYEFLERLPKESNVNVVNLSDFLCRGDSCSVTLNNQIVYRDSGHLSYQGSIAIFNNYNLLEEIYKYAK